MPAPARTAARDAQPARVGGIGVEDGAVHMIAVPQNLREVGVLVEPLTIAEQAMIEAGEVQERLPG
jgi:hypothetical protein